LGPWAYVDSGKGTKGNPYVGFDPKWGQFVMTISTAGKIRPKTVQVLLGEPLEPAPVYLPGHSCYPSQFPDVSAIKIIEFRTKSEYVYQEGEWIQTGQALNVRDMAVGEIKHCFLTIKFTVSGIRDFFILGGQSPATPVQVVVEEGPVWVVRPAAGFVNRRLLRKGICDEGLFPIDFELRVTYK
jgi:hypothetical protein